MKAKFKVNEIVRFTGDDKDYKVIRSYLGNDGMFKYDLSSLDGKTTVIAMPENTIHDDSFPKGMEEEIVRLGKKKGKK